MNEQMETDNTKTELLAKAMDLNTKLLGNAAQTYAYNKINNILLMQILAKLENRDLEEVRDNVDKYIADFSAEFLQKNSGF
jgi:uncharacterized protein YbcC (UPF0753/DUF2309 family)